VDRRALTTSVKQPDTAMTISRRLRIAGYALAAVLALSIVGLWIGVPIAARWGIETVGSREVGRALRVSDVRFNPFTLTATLSKLSIAGLPDEQSPLLSIESLQVNVSSAALIHRAPVLEALKAQGVRANLVRVAENRFNFSDIVDRILAQPASPNPARFALYNVEIDDAAIAFDDHVQKSRHALEAIRLGVPFVSSLPDDVEIKVQPSFSARLDGQLIELRAETQPFEAARDSSIALKLTGIDLPRYLGYVPARLNFALKGGVLDTDVRVQFRRAAPAAGKLAARTARLSLSGALAVRDFSLAERGASAPLFTWRRLDVVLDDVSLLEAQAKVRSVTFDGLQSHVTRRADGSIAGMNALTQPIDRPPAPADAKTDSGKPFAFEVGALRIQDAVIDFRDDGVRFARRIAPISLALTGLSNHTDSPAKLAATFNADDQTKIVVNGDVGLAPLRLALTAELTGLPLRSVQPYIDAIARARVDGSVDGNARLRVAQDGAELEIKVEEASIDAKSLRLRDNTGGAAALDLTRLTLSAAAVDVGKQQATISQIKADGLRLKAARLADGSLDWSHLLPAQKSTPTPAAPAKPWTLRLGEVQLTGGRIDVTDHAVEPAARLAVDNIAASVREFASEGSARSAVNLRARTGGGSVTTRGWLRMTPLAANLDIDVANVDVAALRPYLQRFANAILSSGSVWTKGKLALESGKPAPAEDAVRVAYDGSARVTNLLLLDAGGDSELVRWQVLILDAIRLRTGVSPPEVSLGSVALSDFYARVILSAEGRLNLIDVFRSSTEQETTQGQPTPPSIPATASTHNSVPPRALIRIGGIELTRGNVNFTDNFVRPNYTAKLTDLGGTVSALASDTANPADVSIRGRVDSDAPVDITGKINPLAPKLFLDIAASAKGVELPRLTPYSVKYAGYPITKGKLSMDVKYSIDNDQLKADNHLFLDQLTFGERVESPTATKLPVLFAVSLLKNRRGEIDINLPVSGSLNDPQFSIGGIIVRVIINLLTKAITAPFSLLAAAFGGGEELGYLEFPAGNHAPPRRVRAVPR